MITNIDIKFVEPTICEQMWLNYWSEQWTTAAFTKFHHQVFKHLQLHSEAYHFVNQLFFLKLPYHLDFNDKAFSSIWQISYEIAHP